MTKNKNWLYILGNQQPNKISLWIDMLEIVHRIWSAYGYLLKYTYKYYT